MFDNNKYLTGIPQEIETYGFCKVLAVRHEIIHLKHILTEIFVRKTIDIENHLNKIDYSLFNYMEFMTNRMRKINHFTREYRNNLDKIVKAERDHFFPTIELLNGFDNAIVLDFDGVITKTQFEKLYRLCFERCNKVIVCSGNPTVTNDYFIKRDLPIPTTIHACKGKIAKMKRLIALQNKHDYIFYVDNEIEYLNHAGIFGIRTFHYTNNQIKSYTRKTK